MRPKVTFLDHTQKHVGWGIPSNEDVDLDADTADFMATWRGKYQRLFSRSHNPTSQDIKATLRALTVIQDAETEKAIRHLDLATLAQLLRVSSRAFWQRNPRGYIPLVTAQFRDRLKRHGVRQLAEMALATYPRRNANTTLVSGMDHLFAVALVRLWNSENPDDRARVANPADGPTAFQEWTWEMFARVGRRSNRTGGDCLAEASLTRILSRAIRQANGHP